MDLRPSLDPLFDAFSVPATITLPGVNTPITTAIIPPMTESATGRGYQESAAAVGGGSATLNLQSRIWIRRDAVAVLPIGTRVQASLIAGGASVTWTVQRVDAPDLDPELWEAVVI